MRREFNPPYPHKYKNTGKTGAFIFAEVKKQLLASVGGSKGFSLSTLGDGKAPGYVVANPPYPYQ